LTPTGDFPEEKSKNKCTLCGSDATLQFISKEWNAHKFKKLRVFIEINAELIHCHGHIYFFRARFSTVMHGKYEYSLYLFLNFTKSGTFELPRICNGSHCTVVGVSGPAFKYSSTFEEAQPKPLWTRAVQNLMPRVFNDLIDDFTKSDFKSFWDNFEISKIVLKYGDLI
jgi:hypothetical protein